MKRFFGKFARVKRDQATGQGIFTGCFAWKAFDFSKVETFHTYWSLGRVVPNMAEGIIEPVVSVASKITRNIVYGQ